MMAGSKGCQQVRQQKGGFLPKSQTKQKPSSPRSGQTLIFYLNIPAIGGGLVKFLSQLKGDLCGLEGARVLQYHLVAIYRDNEGGFDHVPHLAQGHAHTCREHQTRTTLTSQSASHLLG